MATIGKVSVSVVARTGQFTRGMKASQGALKSFGGSVMRSASRLAAFGGGLAALAAGGGLMMMVKRSMSAIDATAKLSDQLGIATERLGGFQHAARITGVSEESLNKGLQKFVRNLGDASTGYGEAIRGIKMLGLSAEELTKKSPADALLDVADAIAKMPSPMLQAAAAATLFGRGGQDMMNFLKLGSRGLAEMQREAEKLGITLTGIDSAKVTQANDALARMREVFIGLSNTLTVQLAPAIDAAATSFVDWATSGESMGAKVTSAVESVAMGFAWLSDSAAFAKGGFYALSTAVLGSLSNILKYSTMVSKAMTYPIIQMDKLYRALGVSTGITDKMERGYGILDAVQKSLAEDAVAAGVNMANAFEEFDTGANKQRVTAFFDDIKARAQDAAEAIAKGAKSKGLGVDEVPGVGAKGRGVGEKFQTLALARYALNGTAGSAMPSVIQVRSMQLDESNELLAQIAQRVSPLARAG